jgi:hypothetical protein
MKAIASIVLVISLIFLLMHNTKSSPTPPEVSNLKITRIWHGWTSRENADKFERLLTTEAIPGIEKNRPDGCVSIQLLRREVADEVEFTTVMQFNSIEAIKAFAGEDYEAAHIDPNVKPLLLRYDERVAHHQMLYSKVWETSK